MKKNILIMIGMLGFCLTGVFGLSIDDFEKLDFPGNVVTQVGSAVNVTGTGYYPQGVTGVLKKEAVSPKNFEFEVSIDRVTGGSDTWYSFCLMNKKAFFDINDASRGEGLVVLMRPTRSGSSFTVQPHLLSLETNGFFEQKSNYPLFILPPLGTKFKVSLQKSSDGYTLTINGVQIADKLEWLKGLYPNDKAWFSFSACDMAKKRLRFTLYSIKG